MAHVDHMTIFDCPRITFVRDDEHGCISFYFGKMSVNVYADGATPELLEVSDAEAARRIIATGLAAAMVEVRNARAGNESE